MREIIALAGKDLRLLARDKAGSFFVFFFPLLFAIFFGVIFSGEGGGHPISIALVDEDSSAGSRDFIKTLSQKEELRVLDTTRIAATDLVRRGKKTAYVVLRKGFGKAREQLFWGEGATLEIGVDPSRKAEAGMLQGILTRYYMEGMFQTFQDPKKMQGHLRRSITDLQSVPDSEKTWFSPLLEGLQGMDKFFGQLPETTATDTSKGKTFGGWEPLKVEVSDVAVQHEGPKNPFEVTFPQAILWGMLGCAAAFGISLVTERTKGTLVRLRIAPIARWQILAGKALACFLATYLVSALLLIISVLIFHVRPYSWGLFLLALTASSLCFVGIMMLLSVLGKTEASASGIGWAVLLVMAMISGGMIPLFFMPSWMQLISNLSPMKWVILSIEGAVWRGFSLNLMLAHCGLLVAIGAAFFTLGAKVFAWMGE